MEIPQSVLIYEERYIPIDKEFESLYQELTRMKVQGISPTSAYRYLDSQFCAAAWEQDPEITVRRQDKAYEICSTIFGPPTKIKIEE